MNDAILIQQCYPGYGYEPMIELTRERNQQYCDRWGFDYQCLIDSVNPDWPPEAGGWAKIMLIKRALDKGYKYIVWLDADAMIYDLDTDLREGCPNGIGACYHRIPQLNHWNVGVLLIKGSVEAWRFVTTWLSCYPGDGDGWNEQGVFNRLSKTNKIVSTISDRWNATLNVNMVPDAVILGFHGAGNAEQRFTLMKQTLERISAKKAELTQDSSEVTA